MSDSFKAPTSTGERQQSILAEAAKLPPIIMSSNQGSAPKFSFGPLSQRDMVDLSKPASAIERARSSLAEVGRSTPIPTSTSSSGTTYQPSAKPFSLGPLSQNMIEPSNAPSSTPIPAPSSSGTAHQSFPQPFRFGPYAPPSSHQTHNQRVPAQDKVEAQAARIRALESGFGVLTERYEKASGLADKYEGLLKTVEKEYVDKVKASENNNALVLKKATDSYEARIKALQDEKGTLEKLEERSVRDVSEWERKHSILMETNKEHVATISSLTKTKAVLRNELTSSLATVEGLTKKIERLTASDRKWEELVDTIEKDNEELRAENSEFEKQNGEYLVNVSALNETQVNLERELRGSLQILEMLETDDSLELNWKNEEESKNLIDISEKDDDEAVHHHCSGQEEAGPAKELEEALLLAAPVGSAEKMEESSEKKANLPRQNLWFLGFLLLFFLTVWWTIPFKEWLLKSGINIERAFFLLRIWIFDLGNRLF